MAELSSAEMNDLPDSAFAYIEAGGEKDPTGKTVPRSLRHFAIHDAAHVRNALSRAPQSPFGDRAMPKIKAAAAKFGVSQDDDGRSITERVPVERRYTDGPVECRTLTEGKRIVGYGAVFNRMSKNLGGFVERVMPTAFNQAQQGRFTGAVCRYNHDGNMLLGTTAGGTLSLEVDRLGLHYDVLPPQSRADILELVERGDVQHSSFAFRVPQGGEEWSLTDDTNYPQRSLYEVQLVDVAPVVDPAYPDSSAGIRSLAEHMGVELAEVRRMAEADELRRFFARTDRSSIPNVTKPAPAPKKRLLGVAAMTELQARRFDPYIDADLDPVADSGD